MGAVTAIMYGDKDPSIAGMVLDSAFSSLKKLVEELVKEKINLPNFIINQALKMVKTTVQKKANFFLENIEPIEFAERCFIPALFVAANNDAFVRPQHSKLLYDVYPGDKNLVNVEGDHNSPRPRFFKDSAAIFFYNTLQVQFIKEISDNYAGFYYKNKEVFDDSKSEKENNCLNKENENNKRNNKRIVNSLGDHNINPEEKRGGAIPPISSEINLKNMDFDDFNDFNDEEAANEEEILKFILEQSRKDFAELEEVKNKIDFKSNENHNNNNNVAVDYENMKNLVYQDSDEFVEVNRNDLDLDNADLNKKENNLFDFLNKQVKTNNKENVKVIEMVTGEGKENDISNNSKKDVVSDEKINKQ